MFAVHRCRSKCSASVGAGQLLDKMIVGKRPSKEKKERDKVGYHVFDEDDVDRYVRSGSVAIERWGASVDGGGID